MNKFLAFGALLLALATLGLPFMSVGEITTGAFVGVVKKPALVVFLVPTLVAGLLAGIGGLRGFGKGLGISSIVLGIAALGVWGLMFAKLKTGASAELGMYAMGVAGLAALLAGITGLAQRRSEPAY
ncbi:MAG: hypothetical protein K0V04_01240 [Deltaproteobacteria bacterium]|nr:hypothetical protein [Deltaproteobacteria bacterium]